MKRKNTDKNPFNIPKDYFNSFEDKLKDRIFKEDSFIPKNDGFGIPESYFEQLQAQLTAKVEEEKSSPKVTPLYSYKKFLAIAASIAALLILAVGINWNNDDTLSFTDLANSEIEAYFNDTEIDLSSDEIAEVLPIDGYEINDFVKPEMTEENLLDYLNENVENFEELNLEDNE
ncbi:hypothetical protein [Maribacter cobaltidurans]|uniref:Uncharacterized protein n=1 Tax=Maribacter cobaltidurans TaxID=1178778 RepID=A0A223V907_9FLAO|nr:hypothetical protein [Maribacter cobaltidurans]ASV31883.1 hypothetical protein CJ263_17590 [Maribacter cobaltidurans]GGD85373.1 hypothetical protein GCM10011412_23950 [Maribacter cobaltidurans]